MPRTFSLARLFIAVTLIAALCGFAVNLPLLTAIFIPPVVSFLVLHRFSRHRVQLVVFITVGTIIGVITVWMTVRTLPPAEIMEAQGWEAIAAVAIATTACALTCGATALLDEFVHGYVTPKDQRLNQPREINRLPSR